jgi:hypothetical protein
MAGREASVVAASRRGEPDHWILKARDLREVPSAVCHSA